jgi:two-component system, NtrC family, response regulator HydG
VTILITGESGTGKEVLARYIHARSDRKTAPFVAVNVPGIPPTLVESELFGHERGSFTGADRQKLGKFELANGGTLFLDEIGDLALDLQSKVLRALQEHEIERVGGSRSIRVDVRVVAATNVDLWEEVEARRFRRDLFFRLNVFPIDLPPLRARRDDIPLLVDHFTHLYATQHGRRIKGLTNAALEALLNYDYPGNIRELQNLIERGVICAGADGVIDRMHIFRQGETQPRQTFVLSAQGRLRAAANPATQAMPAPGADISLVEVEQTICANMLGACGGNVAQAARRLGLTRATLDYRLRKWGLLASKRAARTSS